MYRLQRLDVGYSVSEWPEVVRAVTRLRPDVVSVDVFDTCLVRDLASDQAVERAIRLAADRSASSSPDGMAGEIERQLCRPVPGVEAHLREIRRADAEVVFLSDTDRPSELLIDLLRHHGIFADGDRLVSSCEAGSTKSDGRLFRSTWPDAGNGRVVWHVGNHLWADVAMAAAAGVIPRPLLEADTNRYERAMAARSGGYGPALAAAARLARLGIVADQRAGKLDPHRASVQRLGADVAGQAMAAFVLWVAEQCRVERVDHVGFLARDGELPFKVAAAMPADHWEGRSLRYIHCSRLTWSLAAASAIGVDRWLTEGTLDDDAFLHAKRHHVPLGALLARVGLTQADLVDDPDHKWLAVLDQDTVLPEIAAADWEALLADPAVRERIAVRSDERLKLIVDRLRSEGMPAGRYGLVDVGWRGRLASQVSAVLAQVVGEEPVHFHFGGDKVLPDVDARVPIRRFAFDGVTDPFPIEAPVSCIETLTASGKPRVVDYRRAPDGSVELVFDRPAVGEAGDRSELWAGAMRMAELIPSRASLDRWGLAPESLAEETRQVLDRWWNRPTRHDADAFRGLTFEHDEAGTALRPLIRPYRLYELRRTEQGTSRQWPQGSAVISGRLMAGLVRSVRSARRIRRRLPVLSP